MSRPFSKSLRTACTATPAWLAVASIALGSFIVVTSEFLPIGLLTSIAGETKVSAGTGGAVGAMQLQAHLA